MSSVVDSSILRGQPFDGVMALVSKKSRALTETIVHEEVFTALHAMQTRYRDENSVRLSVCLSVCPSVTRVYCDKTEERSVQIFTPYER